MSAPRTSRRAFLAAGAAAAAIGAPIAHAAALPDPVLALIEAERAAFANMEGLGKVDDDAEQAFWASPWHREPRVQVGDLTAFVRGPDFDPIPQNEWVVEPVYVHSHAAIDRECDEHARLNASCPVANDENPEVRRARLHRAFDEDAAAIENAPEVVRYRETQLAWKEANRRAEDALLAVCEAAPTTAAGLLAMLALFEEREIDNLSEPHDAHVVGLFAAVRSLLAREA